MLWVDTSTNPDTLRIRNPANTAWIEIGNAEGLNLGLATKLEVNRPYIVSVFRTTDITGISTGDWREVVFDDNLNGLNSDYNSTTGRWTCPATGLYRFTSNVFQTRTGSNSTATFASVVDIGGVYHKLSQSREPANTNHSVLSSGSICLYLTATTQALIRVFADNSTTRTIQGGLVNTNLTIERIWS
jgi:hypothetical protein